jgi:hypothetical protein
VGIWEYECSIMVVMDQHVFIILYIVL